MVTPHIIFPDGQLTTVATESAAHVLLDSEATFDETADQAEAYKRIIDEVSEADRRWFEAHPNEHKYFRSYVPGEFGFSTPLSQEVLVRQIVPGQRTRTSCEPMELPEMGHQRAVGILGE